MNLFSLLNLQYIFLWCHTCTVSTLENPAGGRKYGDSVSNQSILIPLGTTLSYMHSFFVVDKNWKSQRLQNLYSSVTQPIGLQDKTVPSFNLPRLNLIFRIIPTTGRLCANVGLQKQSSGLQRNSNLLFFSANVWGGYCIIKLQKTSYIKKSWINRNKTCRRNCSYSP